MIAYLSAFVAVLLWSLYPVAASIGLDAMTTMQMILFVYFFSGFGALIFGGLYLWRKKLIKQSFAIQKTLPLNAYLIIFISGISGILCHALFIISLTFANRGGVSLLYESWPIIALLVSPFLMKKTWKQVSPMEYLVSFIAIIGVACIIFADKEINLEFNKFGMITNEINLAAFGGYIMAFTGGYLCAILVVTKGAYAEYFEKLNDDFGTTLISEIFSRTISMIIMTIAFFMFKEELDFQSIHWGSTFFVGFVVFVVGGALFTYALLKANSPTIHILYYFVPVFAVVWLWVAGQTTVNHMLFIGGFIILASNAYLLWSNRLRKEKT